MNETKKNERAQQRFIDSADDAVSARVQALMKTQPRVLVAIDGNSCAGKTTEARKLLDETENKLKQVPSNQRVRLFNQAIHHRSALALCPRASRSEATREIRERAVRFYVDGFRQGLGAFRDQAIELREEA